MDTYQKATGATFNATKCEAVLHKITPPPVSKFFSNWQTDPTFTFTYLGVPCSLQPDLATQWAPALTKLHSTLDSWRPFGLSLTGKITVLKTFAHPTLSFLASHLPLPKSVLDRVARTS